MKLYKFDSIKIPGGVLVYVDSDQTSKDSGGQNRKRLFLRVKF